VYRVVDGTTFEVDQVYQNAGKKVRPIVTQTIRPADGPGTLWVKRPGHATMDNDRPPIIHIISRETGEEHCWVAGHSDPITSQGILAEAVPPEATMVYSDEYRSYRGMDLAHATVNHSQLYPRFPYIYQGNPIIIVLLNLFRPVQNFHSIVMPENLEAVEKWLSQYTGTRRFGVTARPMSGYPNLDIISWNGHGATVMYSKPIDGLQPLALLDTASTPDHCP
jgi:hypothetical protein